MSRDASPRALALRILGATMAHDPRARPEAARRILLLRHDRIGDMLMSTGLLRALAALPNAVVDVAASASNAPVLAHHPAVRRVHVVRRGLAGLREAARDFRGERYDAVIDGLVLNRRVNSFTALLLAASRAPLRIGIGERPHDFLFTHRVRPERSDAHHVEYLAALASPFGVRPRDVPPPDVVLADGERTAGEALWRSAPGGGMRILVNLSAGDATRRWPDARFADLLERVRARATDAAIALLSAPADRDAAVRLAAPIGASALDTSLREALAVVAGADLVVTPDTSVAHAAAALARPQVVMLPSIVSPQFIPYALRGHAVYTSGRTLETLDIAPVWAAVEKMLNNGAARATRRS